MNSLSGSPECSAPTLMPAPHDSILLVIDFQEKLVPLTVRPERVEANIVRLLRLARTFDMPTLVSEQYVKGLGRSTARLLEETAAIPTLEKMEFSCWRNDALRARIAASGRRHAILCGIESHVCVLQTALDLRGENYDVFISADAVTSRTPLNRRVGLRLAAQAGAVVTSTETIIFAFLERCGTPRFKAMLEVIK